MYTHISKKKKRNQILNKKNIIYKKNIRIWRKREKKIVCERTKNIEKFLLHSQMLRDCDTV